MKLRVLFLCATHSVQSPMAEALLNQVDSEHFEAFSAGIDCGEYQPLTAEVMKEIGVDLKRSSAKEAHDFLHLSFDFVITLCDRARSECPRFQGAELIHWQFEDPLTVSDPARHERLFRSLRDQIAQRVRLFALVQARFASVAMHAQRATRSQPDLVHH